MLLQQRRLRLLSHLLLLLWLLLQLPLLLRLQLSRQLLMKAGGWSRGNALTVLYSPWSICSGPLPSTVQGTGTLCLRLLLQLCLWVRLMLHLTLRLCLRLLMKLCLCWCSISLGGDRHLLSLGLPLRLQSQLGLLLLPQLL